MARPQSTTASEIVRRLAQSVDDWAPTDWYPMSSYSVPGQAAAAFYRNVLGLQQDPSGIYFLRARRKKEFEQATGLALKRNMFYIGRAGQIARRLNRHLQVVNQNSASLIYKITALSLGRTDWTRKRNMSDKKLFEPRFREYQAYLRDDCEVAYFSCDNDEEQALLEIMFWLRFRTQFNEWKTH